MSATNRAAIVIDCGSAISRLGFAGDDDPRVVFPSIVCHSPHQQHQQQQVIVGDEAQSSMNCPIERGVITNWDDMELLWEFGFKQLKANPHDHAVLVTETPTNPTANRERTTELMFETFAVSKLSLIQQPLLALYASGRITGTVLESGDGVTHAVSVSEGFAVPTSTIQLDTGGRDLTDLLMTAISVERHAARDIKEKLCRIAFNYEKEVNAVAEESFKLPDGQLIAIGNERFRIPETLFRSSNGIHEAIFSSITKCDTKLQSTLAGNIVLSGGNSMFPGIGERVQKEVKLLYRSTMPIKIIARPQRNVAVWHGGSTLATLASFTDKMITKRDYEESGAAIVGSKCC